MKIKTAELTGAALAWAIAHANKRSDVILRDGYLYVQFKRPSERKFTERSWEPHVNWAQGGPIIEREKIELTNWGLNDCWKAHATDYACNTEVFATQYGLTPLVAAMRCFAASKLGDEIDIPEELLK